MYYLSPFLISRDITFSDSSLKLYSVKCVWEVLNSQGDKVLPKQRITGVEKMVSDFFPS